MKYFLIIQFLMKASLLDSKLTQSEESALQCEIRYIINATYAVVTMQTTKPNSSPLTSEMKKSSNRYPFISITNAATNHANLCSMKTKSQNKSG